MWQLKSMMINMMYIITFFISFFSFFSFFAIFSFRKSSIDFLRTTVIWLNGKPKNIRCDNGPEFIYKVFQEWCKGNDINIIYIQPGHPTWMIDYNECRPHESLDNMTPMEYSQKRKAC